MEEKKEILVSNIGCIFSELNFPLCSLEAYTTPLDEDDCDVDEYNIFKEVLGGLQVRQYIYHRGEIQFIWKENVIPIAGKYKSCMWFNTVFLCRPPTRPGTAS